MILRTKWDVADMMTSTEGLRGISMLNEFQWLQAQFAVGLLIDEDCFSQFGIAILLMYLIN